MTKPEGFSVGQVVFVVYHTYSRVNPLRYSELKVEKVGRTWVTLDGGDRFGLHDDGRHYLDGGQYSSPGRVYRSREEYEAEKKRDDERTRLYELVSDRSSRAAFTPEQISRALAALTSEGLLPEYHEILGRLCREFGVPGSPDLGGAIAWIKERRR